LTMPYPFAGCIGALIFRCHHRHCRRSAQRLLTVSLLNWGLVFPPNSPTPFAVTSAQAAGEESPPALGWAKNGAFALALLQDQSGDIWAGTEDKGVWRYSFADKKWMLPKAESCYWAANRIYLSCKGTLKELR
jgi:ligand-binding sensor domain-containing protein